MNTTVFGKIIRGELPSTKVYEDEEFLAFFTIDPETKGHTLLIPKEHIVWIHEASDEMLSKIMIKAKEIIKAQIKGLNCDYVKLIVVGDEVPHLHIHLVPRYRDSERLEIEKLMYKNDEEKNKYAEKIISGL